MNLATIIESHPDDAPALVYEGEVTTYGELRSQVGALRRGFAELGLRTNDRVALLCGNDPYFVISYLAIVGSGLVAVPLNPLSPRLELQRELAAVDARAVVVGAGVSGVAQLDRAAVPALEFMVAATNGGAATGDRSPAVTPIDDLLTLAPDPISDRAPDDLAALVFTSGTAGRPKAAMLTHSNLLSNIEQLTAEPARRVTLADVALGVLPLFHIFGLTVAIGRILSVGASLVIIPRFDPVETLATVREQRVTIIPGAPAMWTAWANLEVADRSAFASVRLGLSGSDRLPAEIAEQIHERFGLNVFEGYGLTEASPVVTSSIGEEPRWGSIGRPLNGVELRLVDADGDDALVDDPGEIWVRGPNVFAGYWNDIEATAVARTPDGWLRSGDMAVVDDDGYLYLVDRAKDLIIVSGFNVFPAEVEDVLITHPAIDGCAVVGIPHTASGEAVRAYVIPSPDATIDEADVLTWCSDRLARYKCPEDVVLVDELPEGLSGKVLRQALRDNPPQPRR